MPSIHSSISQLASVNRSEEIEQARFVRWTHLASVRAIAPMLRWLHHSPNGGRRDGLTGGQMKALGTKPGFPDLILPVRTDAHTGLAIEFKAPDGSGRLSPLQSDWLAHLEAQGHKTAVVTSADDARTLTLGYLGVPVEAAPALP